MDHAEIDSLFDEVEERHEEAEAFLVEVRDDINSMEAEGMLDDCEDTLEEISRYIEQVRDHIRSKQSDRSGDYSDEKIIHQLARLTIAGFKQEQLEDAHEGLSRACR